MARDYASSQGKGKGRGKAAARKRHAAAPATPGWVWMLLGIAIGAVAAAAFWIMRPTDDGRVALQRSAPAKEQDSGPKLPPEEESRFSFYEMLPSYEVVIPREEVAPEARETKPKPETRGTLPDEGDFIIQVGSFRSREDADAQRAQLALIGVEARIERVTIDASQTWYRVRVGPISDAAKVHSVMVRLQEHGLKDVMLMRVRG